ncbi:MAG: hypothetical protein KUG56_05480 [Kordiimonadaceae bacterium]|nr:hypothetical protein [Kordiimonadaceae bacterium]
MTNKAEMPNGQEPEAQVSDSIKKRNRVVGLSLFVFVIALGVISYFRVKGLTP